MFLLCSCDLALPLSPPPLSPPPLSPTALPWPDRFALVIDGLRQGIAARGIKSAKTGPIIILIWSRLCRIGVRFAALAALAAQAPAAIARRQSPRRAPPPSSSHRARPRPRPGLSA